ncbi:WD40-repeat-containing domain protein [Trametes meyenii]|nr:WD40-repeat-containing domain protein [Trametes meyenii]
MDISRLDTPLYVPWYRKPERPETPPYTISTLLTSTGAQFKCTACFPWAPESLDILWDGHAAHQPELISSWKITAKKWMGAIAVGGKGRLFVFPKLATGRPFSVALTEPNMQIDNVAWAISSNSPLDPLIVFTVTSVILIFNVNSRSIVGQLRGHGGPITSLSVHPAQPNLFCTTSRDFTTRIYDLALEPVQVPNNPHWLPLLEPSLAGPAHGLHMCEPEGQGIGQCVAVLAGGRSGGHKATVLCSAFHPSQPLIATGGVDRAVKIWRIPPAVFSPPDEPRIAREDKPLFSTDLLHKARVESVYWLADDILVSRSAEALMRKNPDIVQDIYYEEGTGSILVYLHLAWPGYITREGITAVVWQWLSLNRFFPPGKVPQKVMRGTASDYRNSESFKVLSAYHLPMTTPDFHVYRSITHDPILLIPIGKTIRLFNISQFRPRTPPKFPGDDLAYLTDRMQLQEGEGQSPTQGSSRPRAGEDAETTGGPRDDAEDPEDTVADSQKAATTNYPLPAPLAFLFEAIEGWNIDVGPSRGGPTEIPDIAACEVGCDGGVIVGTGDDTLFIWQLQE